MTRRIASDDPELPKTMKCDPAPRSLRIAVVYSRLPFPMMRGDQMTVAHLLSFLGSRQHSVDFYTLALDGEMSAAQDEWLRQTCAETHIFRQSLVGKIRGLALGLLKLLPLQVGMFANPKLAALLKSAVASGKYDIVYCYYPRSAPDVPNLVADANVRTRTFLALQLSQWLNTQRMAKAEHNWRKRLIYRLETALMARFEARIWRRFDRVLLIGSADVRAIQELCDRQGLPRMDNWLYSAHGTDTDRFLPAKPGDVHHHRVVFSGSMLYPPNVQAALWFVKEAWPQVLAAVPDATLVIQGRDPVAAIRNLDGHNAIWVTGTVRDVGELIRSASVCINPMLAAGGMQNKLIEYMASAKAVVATSVANEGILAPPDCIRIADDARAFASEVVRLLTAPDEAAALGLRAREFVLSKWTWEHHFLDLETAFLDAVNDQPSDPVAELPGGREP